MDIGCCRRTAGRRRCAWQRERAPIHLLLSDVVMPEMSGGEPAREMVSVRPDIKILFMSGYNDGNMVGRGLGSCSLLQKPFTEADLVRMVRETLDGR